MKKALQPLTVQQPMVVAVQSLTPEFALWDAATAELKPVYGGNISENSVYTDGDMPKMFRIAAEDESYQNELILRPIPNTIDEVVLNENPECSLVITNCKMVVLPEVKPKKASFIVREHPATTELKAAKMCRPKPTNPKQLFLFPDVEPKNMTA